ncbi:hypothetical protein FJW07_24490 [Mesorhizobium sp. B3-1-9]|uniref:hypothetical protein n=1 Tax=Mesorhizobium sp. B3-1-7 TaxID=2589894 RepID=UPI00112638EC|nr:hypothetical protein [Mesorhizobium sp. B3-1-7]TPI34908.1 hypothetical protein FJW07_24490 [Mesorhizobium sp. B3-1-9]TPI64491.1 hypothetical protein FJ417_02330 [Mesorhizobium sp. B3-1-7]
MRQHMLNGWLVAALIALVCLLGVTAYMEVRKDLPRVACMRDRTVAGKRAAQSERCSTACCGSTNPNA